MVNMKGMIIGLTSYNQVVRNDWSYLLFVLHGQESVEASFFAGQSSGGGSGGAGTPVVAGDEANVPGDHSVDIIHVGNDFLSLLRVTAVVKRPVIVL
jgi:hypothetical protein